MIRAHLATFPPRKDLLPYLLERISPQFDRVFVCLNGYADVPDFFGKYTNIETLIPDQDLKDAGKFAFPVQADDIVFTLDDDIAYPTDYVARTLDFTSKLPLESNTIGYQGNAFILKKSTGSCGWKNFIFHKKCPNIFKVDIIGTGTAVFSGANCPNLDEIQLSAGFVDYPFSRLQTEKGVNMWTLPREVGYLGQNLPAHLWESSLFNTVNQVRPPNMMSEFGKLMAGRSPRSGLTWEKYIESRACGRSA